MDNDGITEFRWRIKNNDKAILLSSSKHYLTKQDAEFELGNALQLAAEIANLKTEKAVNGKFYFNVINPVEDENSEAFVVARSQKYFKTEQELKIYKQLVIDQIGTLGNKEIKNEASCYCKNLMDDQDLFLKMCCDSESKNLFEPDPYSFRVTIVLPGYTKRFSQIKFREFTENLIRNELPAHILPRICWVGKEDLQLLQNAWKAFLEWKIMGNGDQSTLQTLITTMQNLNNYYEGGILYDCHDESDVKNFNNIILGQTHLGKPKNNNDE